MKKINKRKNYKWNNSKLLNLKTCSFSQSYNLTISQKLIMHLNRRWSLDFHNNLKLQHFKVNIKQFLTKDRLRKLFLNRTFCHMWINNLIWSLQKQFQVCQRAKDFHQIMTYWFSKTFSLLDLGHIHLNFGREKLIKPQNKK